MVALIGKDDCKLGKRASVALATVCHLEMDRLTQTLVLCAH